MAAKTITVEVDGHKIKVDQDKTKSWKALRLIHSIEEEEDTGRVIALMSFVEYVSGMGETEILELLGGEDASVESVVGFATEFIGSCYPKNS